MSRPEQKRMSARTMAAFACAADEAASDPLNRTACSLSEISQRSVEPLMPKRKKPPSQTWRVFLDNHLKDLVSIDFLVVPTATFRVLFVLIVLAHHRRRVLHFNVTEHPTALWTAE